MPGILQGGVYAGCIPPYTLGGVYAGCTPPYVHPPCTPLGIPRCTIPSLVLSVQYRVSCSGGRRGPWAQRGGNPWVGASQRLKVLNPVRVIGQLCALLLRLPDEERIEDWIDEGSFATVFL